MVLGLWKCRTQDFCSTESPVQFKESIAVCGLLEEDGYHGHSSWNIAGCRLVQVLSDVNEVKLNTIYILDILRQ